MKRLITLLIVLFTVTAAQAEPTRAQKQQIISITNAEMRTLITLAFECQKLPRRELTDQCLSKNLDAFEERLLRLTRKLAWFVVYSDEHTSAELHDAGEAWADEFTTKQERLWLAKMVIRSGVLHAQEARTSQRRRAAYLRTVY